MGRSGMIYTQQSEELLNELKLASGKNCLVFVISERSEELKELIESGGFEVKEIYLEDVFLRMKEFEKAIEACNEVLKLNADLDSVYFIRGVAYSELHQYEHAIEDYNTAISLNHEYAEAYNNRGLAYSELKRYEEAIEDYNRAIELNPKYAAAYSAR